MNNKYIEVKNSGIHRHGVFAKIDIPKETKIVEYIGEKISAEEGERRHERGTENHLKDPENNAGTYIFILDDDVYLDGDIPENDAKYINHSCEPNCEIDIKDKRIWIHSLRDIKKGEEITYNYGFELYDDDPYFFKKHPCKCGSKNCPGYILSEEEWPKMRELLKAEAKKGDKHN